MLLLAVLVLALTAASGQDWGPAGQQWGAAAPNGYPAGDPSQLHLVGLFYEDEWQEIMAFRAAIDRVNMDKLVLPDVTLVPVVEVLTSTDSFSLSKRVCNLTAQGVAAIFGPSKKENINIVSSICETLNIPHVLTTYTAVRKPTKCRVNLAPDRPSISKAIVDLLEDMAWKTFTIIYEDDEGLFRLQEVLKAHGPGDDPITVRRLGEDLDYRPLLKEIQNSTETRVILDVAADKLVDLFRQARQVNMMGDYISYLATSLDAHTENFADFEEWRSEERGASNVTGLRLVDPYSAETQNALQDWLFSERLRGNTVTLTASEIKTSAALVNDAVHVLARSLHMLNQTEPAVAEQPLTCDAVTPWFHGERIVTYTHARYSNPDLEERGMTGPLSLDPDNDFRRTNFSLTLIDTVLGNATGVWNASGVHLFRSVEEMETATKEMLAKKVMRVVSKIGAPYLMLKDNYTAEPGHSNNDALRGYSLDLIDAIAEKLKFRYEFYLVQDGQYGSLKNGMWNGLIKDLLDRKADLGLCDLTITYDRERAVDFTMPFMTLGISILYSPPEPKPKNRFSFLEPLEMQVWIYMAFAYVAVSIMLFVLARTTPNEWDNPHPCDPDPDELENTFTLINSLWFAMGSFLQQGCDFLPKISPYEWEPSSPSEDETVLEFTLNLANAIWHNVGSIMQQGSDIAPKAPSTRLVAGMWWFFTLIMISSYTANLAAFLTDALDTTTITGAKDLAMQNKIRYGCLKGGSTMSFFQNSNFSDYQRMWDFMSNEKPTVFTDSNPKGVERVLQNKGDYAFFMESTSIEYETARKCELRQVGGLLDSKGYGIAMPRNSPYRTLISGAVLKLQEEGDLTRLKQKWWREEDDGSRCESLQTDGPSGTQSMKLGLDNVGGVFLVLMWGCIAAFFMAIFEFLWNTRTVAIENKISVKEALKREFMFAIRCSGTTKPVRHKTPTSSTGSRSSLSQSSRAPSMAKSVAK
ncbi:hypothetical protein ONE63_003287 [Megalurothrips usitatus]|uniref:Glutamate receptor ionotropic, kainate 2-like n=1 Tax=Megalurothrips usitatus TaxID=439358 RepID=A0AAV7XDU7_9NEOP|nr:hypothetical protein ONE63_003287 [Megalurothrips usitatus]